MYSKSRYRNVGRTFSDIFADDMESQGDDPTPDSPKSPMMQKSKMRQKSKKRPQSKNDEDECALNMAFSKKPSHKSKAIVIIDDDDDDDDDDKDSPIKERNFKIKPAVASTNRTLSISYDDTMTMPDEGDEVQIPLLDALAPLAYLIDKCEPPLYKSTGDRLRAMIEMVMQNAHHCVAVRNYKSFYNSYFDVKYAKIRSIRGDGNCGFTAVSTAMCIEHNLRTKLIESWTKRPHQLIAGVRADDSVIEDFLSMQSEDTQQMKNRLRDQEAIVLGGLNDPNNTIPVDQKRKLVNEYFDAKDKLRKKSMLGFAKVFVRFGDSDKYPNERCMEWMAKYTG